MIHIPLILHISTLQTLLFSYFQDALIYTLAESNEFFYLNAESGLVTTRKFLTETDVKEFTVCSDFMFLFVIIKGLKIE